jgi:hypothetical protein
MNKIFISWSGEPSKTVALALAQWLPNVIHNVEPWVSHDNIRPGARWSEEISLALAETHFGIICVTEINQASPWLNFEAGALAKTLVKGRVCPYLINLLPKALGGPLSQFQSVRADKAGTLKLVTSINADIEQKVSEKRLTSSFEKRWPEFAKVLKDLPELSRESTTSADEWPLVKTAESLAKHLSKLSTKQRHLFREILKSDNRLRAKIFSSFFKSNNRIGGYRADGLYPHMLAELLTFNRDEIVYRCKDLGKDELISIAALSDLCYRVTEPVVRLTNKYPEIILDALYSASERNNPPVEEHRGGVSYKEDGRSVFTDINGKPLEGVFKITRGASPGIYNFRAGRMVGKPRRGGSSPLRNR